MSRSVELPDEVYQRIAAEASAAGTTPAEWIAAQLPTCCPDANGAASASDTPEAPDRPVAATETSRPKTLAERMAPHIGRVASGGIERLSQPSGNAFTDHLVAKKREGQL